MAPAGAILSGDTAAVRASREFQISFLHGH